EEVALEASEPRREPPLFERFPRVACLYAAQRDPSAARLGHALGDVGQTGTHATAEIEQVRRRTEPADLRYDLVVHVVECPLPCTDRWSPYRAVNRTAPLPIAPEPLGVRVVIAPYVVDMGHGESATGSTPLPYPPSWSQLPGPGTPESAGVQTVH